MPAEFWSEQLMGRCHLEDLGVRWELGISILDK